MRDVVDDQFFRLSPRSSSSICLRKSSADFLESGAGAGLGACVGGCCFGGESGGRGLGATAFGAAGLSGISDFVAGGEIGVETAFDGGLAGAMSPGVVITGAAPVAGGGALVDSASGIAAGWGSTFGASLATGGAAGATGCGAGSGTPFNSAGAADCDFFQYQ
jgi:hypothetical protein